MAKAKSKKITMEDALVSVTEQPYEVPENWCWTKIDAIAEFERGITFPASAKESEKTDDNIPCIRTANIQDELDIEDLLYVNKSYMKSNQNKLVRKDDIIMSSANSRELVGKVSYVHEVIEPMTFGGFVLGIRAKGINPLYLFYDLRYEFLCGNFMGESTQTTNIANINTTTLGKYKFPLPPLPEQQRIVEQIESLFSKLDEAMEKAQEALDSFEERRVAILHKAFEGELTLQWRAEHGVDMSSWRDVPLKDCGRWFGGGTPTTSKKEYWEGGDIPWITSKDMKDRIIEDSLMHITMTGVENSSANYCEEPAVLFVMRSGILRRVFPVCMVKRPFTVNQDLKACVPDGILQEYLYWYCTGFEKDIRDNCMKSGTTVESVEAKKLFDYSIRVAGADEQKEIVNRIEAMLDKEAAAYEAAEEVIENIEVVKKSILAKAFRGELGTNDSSEESSIELLKQIIANE